MMTDGPERAPLEVELELKLDLDLRATGTDFKLELDVITSRSAVGVFGASGSGKTTLLEAIAGLRRQAEQRVRLGNRVFSDRKHGIWLPPERRATGFVPQAALLFPHLNVRQNLLVGARRAGDSGRPGLVLGNVTALLELETLLERSTRQLSGGEQQRVALARALLSGPDLLLLDEPFSGLDAPLRQRLLRLVLRVRDQFRLPMLFVSHDPREVLALCDHVIVLERGRMLTQGAPRDVLEG